jgi:hypothetical protein
MSNTKPVIKNVLMDALIITITLLKIMIPISIIMKILSEFGLIKILGEILGPFMNIIGLPGEFGLVWTTTMFTNIYGGLIVFFNISSINTYTVAQVTVLSSMILLAHTLPIELRIVQKAGVKLWYIFLLRTGCAFFFALILNLIFNFFNLYQEPAVIIWNSSLKNNSIYVWILSELKNYLMIFLIIFGLVILMKILRETRVIEKLNNILEPCLKFLGMSKNAAPVTIIGITLGLSYGGGLIINESKSKLLTKKDIFLSLSLMSLSHSLIEDTLLMLTISASIYVILFGRIFFTIFVIILIINILKKISEKHFEKYFVYI